jgi:hypothetical protein
MDCVHAESAGVKGMNNPIPVPREILAKLINASWKANLSDSQQQSLADAETLMDDYAVDSPMNQGHGNTVDDYGEIGEHDSTLFRVTDGDRVAFVRTCSKEKAKSDSYLDGHLEAYEVPPHSDPAKDD